MVKKVPLKKNTKRAAKKIRAVKPRVEERIVQKRKRKEYLDNYQYHETKSFKSPNPRPAVVIHQRLGDKVGGTYEELTYEKFRTIKTSKTRLKTTTWRKRNPIML